MARPRLALLLPVAALALLGAGAWLEAGSAALAPFETVWIERGFVHVGDDRTARFASAEPEGPSIARTFTLTRIPDVPCLVMDVHHVTPEGSRGYAQGAMHDPIYLNGERLALLNEYVPRQDAIVYTIFLPIDPERLKVGENEVRLTAGLGTRMVTTQVEGKPVRMEVTNRDDFEWGRARLVAGSRVRVRVREGDEPVPARIQVLDAGGERRISFGSNLRASGAERAFCPVDGVAEFVLPRGEPFEIWATRGIEYDAAHARVIPDSAETKLDLSVRRVVDTAGWISGDFHLHAAPSPDSAIPLQDRVASVIAEGVEFGVATDHNRITDYAPAVAALGVEAWLLTAIGDEITTHDPPLGHFNAFPLEKGLPPVPVVQKTATEIFTAAREQYGALVVQLNHPRGGARDYLNHFAFDRRRGAGTEPGYDDTFDALEVFNGHRPADAQGRVLHDWYALLGAGHRVTATGNSDSHTILREEAGLPRNYIAVAEDHPEKTTVAEICEAVRAGRVTVSSGPFLEVTANGKGVGETATAPDGRVQVAIRVQAAPWVAVEQVQVVLNGDVVRRLPVDPSEEVVRFEETVDLEVDEDGFLIVLARGGGYAAPIALVDRIQPMAFTNPIWIQKKAE